MNPLTLRRYGTTGHSVKAKTNAFKLTWNKSGSVHHYDVAITPLFEPRDKKFSLGPRKGMEIVMRLQTDVHPEIFEPQGAYDGKKNLFSFSRYRFTAEEFRVPLNTPDGHVQNPKFVSVKIVYVTEVNVGVLQGLLGGKGNLDSLLPESGVSTALNMLNVFVQAAPKIQFPNTHNARSFFANIDRDRSIRGLELWRGYFQSVRPTFDRIIVNVDVSIGVVVPACSLEQLCADYLGLRNLRDLAHLRFQDFQKLRQFLKGVKVTIELGSHSGKRPKTIRDLVQGVGERTFDKGDVEITVANHFKRTHGIDIRPGSLGIMTNNHDIFPLRVCKTTEQLYKNRLSPDGVSKAMKFSPANPVERMKAIQRGWGLLGYEQSTFLYGAGVSISTDPLEVTGRILPPPSIRCGTVFQLNRPGVWDVVGKRLAKPALIACWTVVNFGMETVDIRVLNAFVNDLIIVMQERGMSVPSAPAQGIKTGDPGNAENILRQHWHATKAQLILVILPENAAPLYTLVKRFGDITSGVVTQCVKWTPKISAKYSQRSCNQYHNNLILKINGKLGGINSSPDSNVMKELARVPTMVLGADVSHPAPGSMLPSITALVSSYDPAACRYAASTRVQSSRTEMIEDLEGMMMRAFEVFSTKNSRDEKKQFLPKRLIFYRDGVSEGEFATVRSLEIQAIARALKRVYGRERTNWPGLTFIVVGKRHHTRFFPDDQARDRAGNGNCYAGFVVDRDIVHPVHHDFYLQSHPGMKGTSRPSHYTVLCDDNIKSADGLEELSYALCHCYARATRSVSIPAPVYYADLVCRRAKFHFDDEVNYSDNISVQSDESMHLDFYKKHFTTINDALKNSMYFL